MLKLVRNTIAEKKLLIDGDDNTIDWKYIIKLQNLQETEGLHLGNKIRSVHINYHRQKMNVKLAAQLLSKSVADAIEFSCNYLKLPQFRNSEGTVKFLLMMNNLFDILNSRSLLQNGLKKPVSNDNFHNTLSILNKCELYIQSLKFSNGEKIISSNRKTGFIGFLICIKS